MSGCWDFLRVIISSHEGFSEGGDLIISVLLKYSGSRVVDRLEDSIDVM